MYGLFYAVLTLFITLATYNDLGFGYSAAYLIPKFILKKDYKKVWHAFKYNQIIEMGTALLISIILILTAPWLAINFFKSQAATNLIYIFIIYFLAHSFLSSLEKVFNGLQQAQFYGSIQFMRYGLALGFSVLFWFFDYDQVTHYAIAWAVALLVTTAFYSLLFKWKNSFLINKLSWNEKLFKKMLAFAIPTILTTSLSTIIKFSDVFYLTWFKGLESVGKYNVIIPLVSLSAILLSPLTGPIFPLASKLAEVDKKKLSLLISFIYKFVPFVAFYFSLFVFLFPKILVHTLFGAKWVGLIETELQIAAIGQIFTIFTVYLATLSGALGLIRQRLKASLVIGGINLVLAAFMSYYFGVRGVIISHTLIYFLLIIILSKFIKQSIDYHLPIKLYIKLILIGIIFYFLNNLLGFSPRGFLQLLVYGVCYTIIILMISLRLKLFDLSLLVLLNPKLRENKIFNKLRNLMF